MTKTEYLEQICADMGIDVSALPDRLLGTFLSAISERLGVMKKDGTLTDYLDAFAGQGGGDSFEAGRKAEYDRFWDNFQPNKGEPFKYYTAFSGKQWNDVTFKPKYNIVCEATNNQNMFTQSEMTDIAGTMKECGVILDTSLATNLAWSFSRARTKSIPVLSLANIGENGTNGLFDHASALTTIERLIVRSWTPFASSTFDGCGSLRNLVVEGTIGTNGFNVQWSTLLTVDSLSSIVDALEKKTSGKWVVTIGAENLKKLEEMAPDKYASALEKGWQLA